MPALPFHPNCRCKTEVIQKININSSIFDGFTYAEKYMNKDNKFPNDWRNSWFISTLGNKIILIYSSEAAFISFDGGINYYQIDMTPDIEKKLRSIPIGLKNGIDIKDKKEDNSVRIFSKLLTGLEAIETEEFKIAKPQRTDGNKSYYLMPDGTELWADLSTLNGMGILPDGTVIIGEGKDNPEYYYKLLVLKERYENIIEKITLRNLTSYVGDNIFHETTTDNIISILK